eukprot:gene20204-24226_t
MGLDQNNLTSAKKCHSVGAPTTTLANQTEGVATQQHCHKTDGKHHQSTNVVEELDEKMKSLVALIKMPSAGVSTNGQDIILVIGGDHSDRIAIQKYLGTPSTSPSVQTGKKKDKSPPHPHVILVEAPVAEDLVATEIHGSAHITRSVHCARSTRPVILLSQSTLAGNFGEFLDFATRIIVNQHSMTVLITPKDDQEKPLEAYTRAKHMVVAQLKTEKEKDPNGKICVLTKSIYDALSARIAFLEDEVESPNSALVLYVNPADHGERDTLLTAIFDKVPICTPSSEFNFGLSPGSQECLEKTISRIKNNVKFAIDQHQYEVMGEAVELANILSKNLGLPSLVSCYNTMMEDIGCHYSHLVESLKNSLCSSLLATGQLDVHNLEDHLTFIKSLDHLLADRIHIPMERESIAQVYESLVQITLCSEESTRDTSSFAERNVHLGKTHELSKFSDFFKAIQQSAIQSTAQRVQDLFDACEVHYVSSQWDKLVANLALIQEAKSVQTYIGDKVNIVTKLSDLLDSIGVKLDSLLGIITSMLTNEATLDFETLRGHWSILSSAASSSSKVEEWMSSSLQKTYMDPAISAATKLVHTILNHQDRPIDHAKLKVQLEKVARLQSLDPMILELTATPYKSSLITIVEQMTIELETLEPTNFSRILGHLQEMKQFMELDSLPSEPKLKSAYQHAMNVAENRITSLGSNIQDLIKDNKDMDKVQSLSIVLNNTITSLSSVLVDRPELSKICTDAKIQIQQLIESKCKPNDWKHSIDKGHWSEISNHLAKLEAFSNNPLGPSMRDDIDKTKSVIIKSCQELYDQMVEHLKEWDFDSASTDSSHLDKISNYINVKATLDPDFYDDINETMSKSVRKFLVFMRASIDQRTLDFSKYTTSLNFIETMECSVPNLGRLISDLRKDYANSKEESNKHLLSNLVSHNYTGIGTINEQSATNLVANQLAQDEQDILMQVESIDQIESKICQLPIMIDQFRRATVIEGIKNFDIKAKIRGIEETILKRLDRLILNQKEALLEHSYHQAYQYLERIQTIVNSLSDHFDDKNGLKERQSLAISLSKDALDKINEVTIFNLSPKEYGVILSGLKEAAKDVRFVASKLSQLEGSYSKMILQKINQIGQSLKDGDHVSAKSNFATLETTMTCMDKFFSVSPNLCTDVTDLKSAINNESTKQAHSVKENVVAGNFSCLSQQDVGLAISHVKSQIIDRLEDIQLCHKDKRYQDLANHITWFEKCAACPLLKFNINTQVRGEIDALAARISVDALELVSSIKSQACAANLEEFRQLCCLSNHLPSFSDFDKSLRDFLISRLEVITSTLKDTVTDWSKPTFAREKSKFTRLDKFLESLEEDQKFLSMSSEFLGKMWPAEIPSYQKACIDLSRSIGERISSFSQELEEGHYSVSASTMWLHIDATNLLKAHKIAKTQDHTYLYASVQTHVASVVATGKIHWSNRSFQDFGKSLEAAILIEKFMGHIPQLEDAKTVVSSVISDAKISIRNWGVDSQSLDIDKIAPKIVEIKSISDKIHQLKESVDETINTILNHVRNQGGAKQIQILGNYFLSMNRQDIIDEYSHFDLVLVSLWNAHNAKLDPAFLVEQFQGDDIDKEILLNCFTAFDSEYKQLTANGLKDLDTSSIAKSAQVLASIVDLKSPESRDRMVSLIAHVFAEWTIVNSGKDYNELKDPCVLLSPHPVQVISIMRLLGIDSKNVGELGKSQPLDLDNSVPFVNQLIEIKTGEGKSVTLGVLSTILALIGFNVHSVCYSSYLSKRDYDAFQEIFKLFEIEEKVTYSDIDTLCNSQITNTGDTRQLTKEFVNNMLTTPNTKPVQSKGILLIDEVDVFFSENFYGRTYSPATQIECPSLIRLIKFIWSNRKTIKLEGLRTEQIYKVVMAEFFGHEAILDLWINDMVNRAKKFIDSSKFIVNSEKQAIGIQSLDQVDYDIVSSDLMFAYMYENERGIISEKSMNAKLCINITCGHFSYAKILSKFSNILGVTGTLANLSEPIKSIIAKDFDITKSSLAPSIFGDSKLSFKELDNVLLESDQKGNRDQWFRKIQENTLEVVKLGRAVLVFFKDEKILDEFYKSPYSTALEKPARLVEGATDSERKAIVSKATTSGQVTLFIQAFGRGEDFKLYDSKVKDAGGVHVIQTFLSEEINEEIQIKGRTARQSEKGSYTMILSKHDLLEMGMTEATITNASKGGSLYKVLDEFRKNKFNTKCKDLKTKADQANEINKISVEYLNELTNYTKDKKEAVSKLLLAINKHTY